MVALCMKLGTCMPVYSTPAQNYNALDTLLPDSVPYKTCDTSLTTLLCRKTYMATKKLL
jgi:hypothetical protein